jgi:hypothetical protein
VQHKGQDNNLANGSRENSSAVLAERHQRLIQITPTYMENIRPFKIADTVNLSQKSQLIIAAILPKS